MRNPEIVVMAASSVQLGGMAVLYHNLADWYIVHLDRLRRREWNDKIRALWKWDTARNEDSIVGSDVGA